MPRLHTPAKVDKRKIMIFQAASVFTYGLPNKWPKEHSNGQKIPGLKGVVGL